MKLPPIILLLGLLLLPISVAARDEQRIKQLKESVSSLEAVVADSQTPKADRPRLQKKLDDLKKELGILTAREELSSRERQIKTSVRNLTKEWIRQKLQTVNVDSASVEARQLQLNAKRAKAAAETEALQNQLADKTGALTEASRAELEQALFCKLDETTAITLQQDAADYELMLIQLATKIREQFKLEESNGSRMSLRALFDKHSEQEKYLLLSQQIAGRLSDVRENYQKADDVLDLARQKLASYDGELQLLERQTGFLRRNVQLEQLLATQRAQQQFVGLRVTFLAEQKEALAHARDLLQAQLELTEHLAAYLGEQKAAQRSDYIDRLLPPLTAVATMVLIYLLSSRLLLPRFFRKEELFLARRLGRYLTASMVTVIMVLFMIEDLQVIVATLGLMSAAVVIALQDVAISFFGWSVIMVSRKFVIGDRLEIDGTVGDVIDIQLLRSTLLEINNGLGVDTPTGRVVVIPNSFVFRSKVFNYSHCHPYVWEKTEITVTFDTPLADATELLSRVLEEETRQDFADAQQYSGQMQLRYGVEDAEYRPKLYTRITENGITFSLIYVGHYRDTTTRNKLNLRLITELENNRQIQLAHKTLTVRTAELEKDKPAAVLHSHPPFHARPPAG